MKKKIVIYSGIVLAVFFLFLVWFKATYSMDKVETRDVNALKGKYKILIATQGSEYKNEVVDYVVEHFKNDSVYLRIEDVSLLPNVSVDQWNLIVLMHTWEIFKPEKESQLFLEKNYDKTKMFVVSTSASGGNRI